MNHIAWKDEYNIGVDRIDKEHQRLFKIINKLFALEEKERNNPRICQEGIKFLKEHAVKHFEEEEAYMESIGYEDLEMHRRLHRGFREETLPELVQELIRTDYAPDTVDHFLGVCVGWLIGHTLTEDRAITGEKTSKWGKLLPEEELKAIKDVITKLVQDLFQLEAKEVSDAYGGEKFGKGVYYRLVYDMGEKDKQWEVILVFEDRTLINTVGKIMGIRSNKLDIMLMNATRYVARQFVWRVFQQFSFLKTYEVKEENFLTYHQFQEVFEKKNPRVSLLFNTKKGYFSYCMIASPLLKQGIGTPIGVDNAMSEIENYLLIREETPKPKVLVVDDSMTIRRGMKGLLGEDYEVNMVKSGTAAIRAITLDRPDLVLLDYEMPICDGRHMLEMLRSEEDFADVPVIFLTSRDDKDSVQKVLELKPEGYILKRLKPVEIKKRIDAYFHH